VPKKARSKNLNVGGELAQIHRKRRVEIPCVTKSSTNRNCNVLLEES